ncbi:hypothetical protein COCC4DRAFT_150871 [Bipolaris maydis ATCC 48331]|uniref:Uncharacterized protein n=2 Tax=Cochliobolus heterostrophus TaxID=5016 RepID=M2UGY3_COCH5|nr:uncharacterized protein COCC4DRAFT_150871 [Bipolaris maydis ATCC 48331]EMD87232.1 hypothetical protein COCHEDRAFT_1206522 [Bipolaris maydis C5]KAJ5022988.1 ankyrin repeat-containing domain protein [Bipolaris maydis]ENI00373.1 hypothetical protein COCC4DRAFT_150871 [Bipolaris maydis ATCC 48331]KAJ6211851.1 ankyrin repeat-containing domain protein [Bipolaris maydis]KAJ6267219.1 ankyrin repeat-containing domain protein [Bipolaris maydis]
MYGEGEGHARKRMREVIEASTVARDAKLSQIERWLSAPDPSVNYQKALKLRQHNTGRWLLDGERYETWKIETASCIWLYGIPGCGKTLLSSTILEDVFRYCDEHPGYAVAYFYFDFNDIQKQNAERMLRSLVVQLLQKSVDIPSSLDALFSSHDNGKRPPALDSLLKVARDLIEHFPQVYIVLDALDECNQWSELMEMLETIASWEIPNLHLIMTSRAEPDIKSTLTSFVDPQNSICLQSNIVDRDIQLYIRQRLSDDKDLAKWKKDPDIQQEIETALTKGSKGMFRWAACQLDTLGRCLNRSLLRKTLKTLPSTLDKTYERILGSISDEYAEYAICILQWLAFSERPLSVEELAEVIAIDVSRDPEFDRDEVLEDPMDVLRICSSLVSITAAPGLNLSRVLRTPSITLPKREVPVRQIIMLAHYSVKEYLISDRVKRGQAARYSLQAATCHGAMAVACLGYLNQFQEPELLSEQTLEKFKLASYSARFWSEHARKAGDQEAEVARFVCRLLSMDNPAYFSWIQIIEGDFFWFDPSFESIKSIVPTPLYCASLLGLDTVVEQFLTQNSDPNARGGTYGNALQAASCITRILLEAGANVSPDGSCKSALHHAIDGLRCTPSLVSTLLKFGPPMSTVNAQNMTPLHFMALHRKFEVIKILLKYGADPNALFENHETSLYLFLNNPHESVSIQDPSRMREVSQLGKAGNHVWVKVLIEYGANVGRTDDSGLNALHYAAQSGNHKTIVAILRTEEAKKVGLVTSKDGSGRNVLHHLLDKKKKARIKTIRFLLSRGADSSAVDDSGCTPLASYLQSRSYINPELCSLLLKFNGNATFSNSKGQNLGHLYIQNRNTTFETLRFLHERGVDLTKKDHEEKTLLHVAATRGSLTDTMLVYLINVVGLGIADQDIHGRDVLQYATERHERIERVEIELSAMFCMEELSVDFCSCSCSGCSGFYRNFYRDSYRDSRLTILRRITELKELATKRNNVTIPVL